jgi:predicted 3-demethylubiquinone-9 3-methyltransferase (glyoxalase superfamily)
MPRIITFLSYKDQAEEAAKLYTSIFKNSKITSTTRYADGAPIPKGTVMTVEFELDGQSFVALNGGEHFKFTDAISLSVTCDTQAEIDEYSGKLTAGGGEQGPCGWLTDRFGLSWQIVPSFLKALMGDDDPAKAARVTQSLMKMRKIDVAKLKHAYEG